MEKKNKQQISFKQSMKITEGWTLGVPDHVTREC